MSAYLANGTRLTAATISKTADPDPDAWVLINTDVYEGFSYPGMNLAQGELGRRLKWKAGTRVRTSEVTALFSVGDVTAVSPVSGPAAGGTVVTLTGVGMGEVTAVTFGGTAGTAISVNPGGTTLTVTTPAHATGAVNIVLTDDSGTVTKTAAYTYV
jgi:hypothetical protein